jgi:hypothetical protein
MSHTDLLPSASCSSIRLLALEEFPHSGIQAALISALEREGFQVPPVIRLSLEPSRPPAGPQTANRYVLSLLLSLEETRPAGEQREAVGDIDRALGDYYDEQVADGPSN